MKKILQISIPTYNRHEKILKFAYSILSLVDLIECGKLSVSIFDNSDIDISDRLDKNILKHLKYVHNGRNIGFHKNIEKCFLDGDAFYKWIIADDDDVDVKEIRGIVDYLALHGSQIAGLIVPYKINNLTNGDTRIETSLKFEFGKISSFSELVLKDKIPFDFLSEFIVKTDLLNRCDFSNLNLKNDYIHALIFCTILGKDDKISIYESPVITYTPPNMLNWSLLKLLISKLEICDTLYQKNKIVVKKSKIIEDVLKWAIFGRIGVQDIPRLKYDLTGLMLLALKNISLRNYSLIILLLLPTLLLREIVIVILSLTSRNKSKLNFLKRYLDMRIRLRGNV